eukprot:749590-Alexandrium_andersonii.AAC.1
MAETARGPPPRPQRPFRALSRHPPDENCTMGESALTGQLGAPLSRRPKMPREGIFARRTATAPVERGPREGTEGP